METEKEKKKRRPKGDGSVQEIAPGKFRIQLDLERDAYGKRKRKSFTGTSQRECIRKLTEWKSEQSKGMLIGNNNTRVSEFITRWLEIKQGQNKQKTYESYVYTCDYHIVPVLGKHKVQKLTTAHINDYIKNKLKEGQSPASVTRQRAIIHNILDLAVKEGIVSRNVSDNCMSISVQRAETKTLSQEEMTQLLGVARGIFERDKGKGNKFYQIYHIVLLALATGARRGELLALKWESIDFDRSTLAIKENLVEVKGGVRIETPKTRSSRRVIAVDSAVLLQLQELKEVNDELTTKPTKDKPDKPQEKSEWVFCTRDGKPVAPSNMSRAWRELLKDAKIEGIRFHDLRHTHATLLVANGTNIKTVSSRIGHTDIRITLDLYASALPEQDREAAEKMGSWLFNKGQSSDNKVTKPVEKPKKMKKYKEKPVS